MNSHRLFILKISAERLKWDKAYSIFTIISLALAFTFVGFSLSWNWALQSLAVGWPNSNNIFAVRFQSESEAQIKSTSQANSLRHALDFVKLSTDKKPIGIAKKSRRELGLTELGISSKGETNWVYSYSEKIPEMLGMAPSFGRLPRKDGDEILVTEAFAQRHFKYIQDALSQRLYLKNQIWTIVGIVPNSFRIPEPIRNQRAAGEIAEIFLPTDFAVEQASLQYRDSFENISVLLGTTDQIDLVEKYVEEFLRQHPLSTGIKAQVLDLHAFVIGDEEKTAWMIIFAATALAITALLGVSLNNIARYISRSNEFYIRQALGASSHKIFRMERYELLLLSSAALVLSILVSFILRIMLNPHLQPALLNALTWRTPVVIVTLSAICTAALLGIIFLTTSSSLVKAGNVRVTLSPWLIKSLRGMLVVQVILSAIIISIITTTLTGNWRVFQAASGREVSDLQWISLQFPPDRKVVDVLDSVYQLKKAVINETSAREAAIAFTDSPIRLMGTSEGYLGGEPDRNARILQENPDGTWVQESAEKAGSSKYDRKKYLYSVSVIGAEHNFPSMLGLQLVRGRMLKSSDQNTVLLTQGAMSAIWGNVTPPGDEWLIPASRNSKYQPSIWHMDLRSVGVVSDGRMLSPGQMAVMDAMMPVVFVPIDGIKAPRTSGNSLRLGILYQANEDKVLNNDRITKLITEVGLQPEFIQTKSVLSELRGYLFESIISAMLAISLNLLVILTLFLGSVGAMHFVCTAQKAEIAIRIALGASERSLTALFFRREVIPHLILLCIASGIGIAVSKFIFMGSFTFPVIISTLLVLVALISGFMIAINDSLQKSVSRLLGD